MGLVLRRCCVWLVWSGALLAWPWTALAEPDLIAHYHQTLRQYQQQLLRLSQKDQAASQDQLAQRLRSWLWEPQEGQLIYLLPEELPSEASPSQLSGSGELEKEFSQLRREYAERFFRLAVQAARAGQVELCFACLNHVARDDPNHQGLRRLLGFKRHRGRWVSPLAASRLRRGWVYDRRWGWLPRSHLKRYEQGQRRVQGRWVSAEQAQHFHSNPQHPWQLESQHFVLRTTVPPEKALPMLERMELCFQLWRRVFASFAYTPSQVRRAVQGGRALPGPKAKFRVVLFASQEQFRQRLAEVLPPGVQTTGYYHSAWRQSFFYWTGNPQDPTLVHELTHQFCAEMLDQVGDVGQRANFWVVEAVACYMESLHLEGTQAMLGGWDADRVQDARYYFYHDRFSVPLERLCALSRQQFQQHDQLPKLYALSAAWAHFLMDAQEGRFRQGTMQYLKDVFRGRDDPGSLRRRLGLSWSELQGRFLRWMQLENVALVPLHAKQLEYLVLCGTRVDDADLKQLPPMPQLQWLDLAGTQVSNQCLKLLARWPKLEQLDLSHTLVTAEAVEEFLRQGQLPRLRRVILQGVPGAGALAQRLRAQGAQVDVVP